MSCLALTLSNTSLSAIATSFLKQTSWQFPYITQLVCYLLSNLKVQKHISITCFNSKLYYYSTMLGSWRYNCLLFTLAALILLSASSSSEASRALPKDCWEQMLPKKLPTPSSAPSKGTNSATKSSSKAFEACRSLPSSDGKV